MAPDGSRRRLLRTAGVAAAVGIAGCQFGTESDGGGPGTNTGSKGGGTGGGGTFSVTVKNQITSDDLRSAPAIRDEDPDDPSKTVVRTVTPDTPAAVRVEAARSVRGEADPILFEKDLELPPGAERSFQDAFTATSGDTYVLRAEMEPLRGGGDRRHFEKHRFQPGQFNTPEDGTFLLQVVDGDDGSTLDTDLLIQGEG